ISIRSTPPSRMPSPRWDREWRPWCSAAPTTDSSPTGSWPPEPEPSPSSTPPCRWPNRPCAASDSNRRESATISRAPDACSPPTPPGDGSVCPRPWPPIRPASACWRGSPTTAPPTAADVPVLTAADWPFPTSVAIRPLRIGRDYNGLGPSCPVKCWHGETVSRQRRPFAMVALTVLAALVILGAITLGNSLRIVKQYERGVVFRLGRVNSDPKEPGMKAIVPFIDRLEKVNLQIV